MKKSRPVLSIILSVIMLLQAMPAGVNAQAPVEEDIVRDVYEEQTDEEIPSEGGMLSEKEQNDDPSTLQEEPAPQAEEADESDSSQCGEDLFWSFDEKNHTLMISGSGEMYDYSPDLLPPWQGLEAEILIMEEGITAVGAHAFESLQNLKKVEFPKSLELIGKDAFFDCSSLVRAEIPETVKELEDCGLGYEAGRQNERKAFETFTIIGSLHSPAQTYAAENGFAFVSDLENGSAEEKKPGEEKEEKSETPGQKDTEEEPVVNVYPDGAEEELIEGDAQAYEGNIRWNISLTGVTTNATDGDLPNADMIFVNRTYYFNLQVTTDVYLQKVSLYVKPSGSGSFSLAMTHSAETNHYFRFINWPYTFDQIGDFSYYWILYYTDGGNQTLDTVTVTVNDLYSASFSISSYTGTYDGSSHTLSASVSDPAGAVFYYSTSNELRGSNYTSGSRTMPSRTSSGTTTVYFYLETNHNNYYDHYGTRSINIRPSVSASAYTGTYDGSSHKPSISVSGNATLYYSTSTQLTYSNYSSSGSTTMPSRTSTGTTTVYYIAVPNSDATSSSVTTGSTSITINKASMNVLSGSYTGTYDGSSHTIPLTVSGPSSYTVYYSTSTRLTSSNYSSSGTTTKPTRTSSGTTTVNFYVKDNTGNYSDFSDYWWIYIKPSVTASAYTGTYDKNAHKPSISAGGSATLYYSTSTSLNYDNYSSSGSTTMPSRTNAGTTTVYYIAVPNSGATSNSVTTGSTTITVNKASMSVTSNTFSGTYDGSSHTIPLTVSGPSSYTVYYSTSTRLTSSNYSSSGTTTKPTRTSSGTTTVNFYVKDNSGNYSDFSDYWWIHIKPSVTASSYSGSYDGNAHKPSISAGGSATLYYSTDTSLTYDNYSSSGSTTMPSLTNVGTMKVYYIAVPNSGATSNSVTTGSTSVTIRQASMNVTSSDYVGTYDGSSHTIPISVSGPSLCSIYYSTAASLTESNYSTTGTMAEPSRTYSGGTRVYYYIKDLGGSYSDYSGSRWIYIKPKVTASSYSGTYDGNLHKPSISVSGDAVLYYSTSTPLTYGNYSSSGSTTMPSRTSAGTTTVYYIAVPRSDPSSSCVTTGSVTISIAKKTMSVTASGYNGTYDGSSHTAALTVSGPSSYTIYYSTSTSLSSSNYSASGTTTRPSRTSSGSTQVYYCVVDNTGNYNNYSGSTWIHIKPKVTASPYTGTYNGNAHKPTVTVGGSAALYYSTATQLTYSNYSSAGSVTVPSRTDTGTVTVYYIAVPSSDASASSVVTGSTTVTVQNKAMSVTASGYTGTYDGDPHTGSLSVSGPSSYTIYYSTGESLNSSNYASAGTTSVPSRTSSGTTAVFYYIRDKSGNYDDYSGRLNIHIKPGCTATSYSGSYDGQSHSPAFSVSGNAALYYSTSQNLTLSNYRTAGSLNIPSRTAVGSTTVYYIAVPNADPSAESAAAGSVNITVRKAAVNLAVSIGHTRINAGSTEKITVTGARGTLTYVSSDPAVAAVSSDGIVTGVKKGTVQITVTSAATENYEAASRTVTVIVNDPLTGSIRIGLADDPSGQAATEAEIGDAMLLTAEAAGGNSPYTYKFLVFDNSTDTWYKLRDYSSENTCLWTPGALGTKTLFADIQDSTGDVVRAKLSGFTVSKKSEPLSGTLSASMSEEDPDHSVTTAQSGSKVFLTAEGLGGKEPYTFKFLIYDTGSGTWYKLRDFESSGSYTWIPGAVGTKDLYVDIRDSKGTVYRAGIRNFTVNEKQPDGKVELYSYSFSNSGSSFGYPDKYKIPLSSYQIIYGDNTYAEYVYTAHLVNFWGGSCAGMAATSALLATGGSGITPSAFRAGASAPKDLRAGDASSSLSMNLTKFIEAMQIAQYTSLFSNERKNHTVFTSAINADNADLDGLYRAVKEKAASGMPTVLALSQAGAGHAVLAYKTEEVSSTEARIYIYDNNYPLENRYITLKKHSGHFTEWHYDIGGVYGEFGTDDESSKISYISYSTIKTIWSKRGKIGDEEENLAIVNSRNFAVYDVQDHLEAVVTNGKLTDNTGKITIIEDELSLTGEGTDDVILILPTKTHTIRNMDKTLSSFEVKMVDTNLGMKVSTTVQEVTVSVDDAYNMNHLIMKAGSNDTYNVILNNSFASGCDEVVVSGKGKGETLSISQDGTNLNFTNCEINLLTVDGREVGLYDVEASAANGGSIAPSGTTSVRTGESVTYTITPSEGYAISSVIVDGENIGPVSTYTFKNIQENHEIYAVFQKAALSGTIKASLASDGNGRAVTTAPSGTRVLITANGIGGSGGYTYKFLIYDNGAGTWFKLRDFTAANTYTWTPGATGTKTLFVDIKDSSGKTYRAKLSGFAVTEKAAALSGSIKASLASDGTGKAITTAKSGTKVLITANGIGGSGGYTYKFLIYDNGAGTWFKLRDFTTTNTYTWTPGVTGTKTLFVDIKDASGTTYRAKLSGFVVKEK